MPSLLISMGPSRIRIPDFNLDSSVQIERTFLRLRSCGHRSWEFCSMLGISFGVLREITFPRAGGALSAR